MYPRKSFIILINTITTNILYLIAYFFAWQIFTPLDFGYTRVSVSFINFVKFFSDLMFTMTHVKRMSEGKYQKNQYFSMYLIIKVILVPLISIIMVLVIFSQIQNGIIENSIEQMQIIQIQFITAIVDSFSAIYLASFQASKKVFKMQIPILFGRIIQLIVAFIAMFFFNNYIIFILSFLFEVIAKLGLYIIFGYKFRLKLPNKKLILEYFSFGFVYVIPHILNLFIRNLGPLIFLSFYDTTVLGVYHVFSNMFAFLVIIPRSFRLLLYPSFSKLIVEKKFKEVKSQIDGFERYVTLMASLFIICASIFGPFFIDLFLGGFYIEHGLNFFYFSLLQVLTWGIAMPYYALIVAGEDLKIYILFSLINLFFTIFCWIFLIPLLGIIALDLGVLLAVIPNVIIMRKFCMKKYDIGTLNKKIQILLITSVVCLLLAIGINQFFGNNIIYLVISGSILLSIFLIIIVLFKILTRDDILLIKELINIRKYYDDFKREFAE